MGIKTNGRENKIKGNEQLEFIPSISANPCEPFAHLTSKVEPPYLPSGQLAVHALGSDARVFTVTQTQLTVRGRKVRFGEGKRDIYGTCKERKNDRNKQTEDTNRLTD